MRILFTGGGTGGHFYPIVAVAREIKKIAKEEKMLSMTLYYTGPDDFGHEILKTEDIKILKIISGKWRRYVSAQNFFDIFKILAGAIKAFWILFKIMPDVIFSKGGYGSIPIVLVAIIYRIPLMIHESDSIAGMVNKFAGRFAARVAVSFKSAAEFFPKKNYLALTGNPIRKNILYADRSAAARELAISSGRPVILVMGGSQGADIINQTMLASLKEFVREFEIVHLAGAGNFEEIKSQAARILDKTEAAHYHLYGYFDEQMLGFAYAASDCIISRAGAGSIFEIAAAGKPSVLLPLKNSAQGHQKGNAYEYADTGGAIVIEEDNLSANVLLNETRKLMADGARRAEMSERAKSFAKIDAAEVIAREIIKLGLH